MILQDGTSPNSARKPPSIEGSSSADEMNPSSLASKMNNFFLETPTLRNPPEFSLSPVYASGGIIHTPSSMAVPTPGLAQGNFQTSPIMPYDITGYDETTNKVIKFEPADAQYDVIAQTPLQQHHSQPALQESFSENAPFRDTSGIETELEYEEDAAVVSSLSFTPEKHLFLSLDDSALIARDDTITIEQFLLQDPFESIEKKPEPSRIVVPEQESYVRTHTLEVSKKEKPPSPRSIPRKTSSSVKTKLAEGQVGFSPKVIRKTKSFSAAISKTPKDHHRPAFSFEDCANEFHITDGNYAFQDETATFSKQFDTSTIKKLTAKSSKLQSNPTLRKAKSTFNLCLQPSHRSGPKVLRNMESGLLSFQLQLKSFEHDQQK